MSNIFSDNIAKNVKTGFILANVAFFVNVFSEKSQKNANYLEKLPKMFKTEFILANVAFFVKVSPFIGQDQAILPGLRSGDLKLQRGRGTALALRFADAH